MSITDVTLTALGREHTLVCAYDIERGEAPSYDSPGCCGSIEVWAVCHADEIPRPWHEDEVKAVSCLDEMTEAEMESIEQMIEDEEIGLAESYLEDRAADRADRMRDDRLDRVAP